MSSFLPQRSQTSRKSTPIVVIQLGENSSLRKSAFVLCVCVCVVLRMFVHVYMLSCVAGLCVGDVCAVRREERVSRCEAVYFVALSGAMRCGAMRRGMRT